MNKSFPCSPIDFVILWVDGNDVEWQRKRSQYMPSKDCDISPNRYRDWDNLRYWFRSVSKYASWVNKIHFVSDGQVPSWLNTENPRLHIVNHKDYIPSECLPLFNSSAIEVGMHNIPDLAEHFVFFNDDIFLTNFVSPSYFFKGNLPTDMPGLTRAATRGSVFGSLMVNNYEVINRYFSKKEVLKKHVFRWLNPFYGKTFLRTLLNCNRDEFDGIVIPHLSVAYRKNDIIRVWEKEGDLLAETQTHRFRDPRDLTHLLFRFWRLCEGDYAPRRSLGKYFSVEDYSSAKSVAEAILSRDYPEICINDCYAGEDFERAKNKIIEAFVTMLPERCEYERE